MNLKKKILIGNLLSFALTVKVHTCPLNPILLIKQYIPSLTGLAQTQLETVIPKSEGAFVLVVSGKYRGQVRNRSYLPLKAF